jgi:c-di-GMP-binding flagellar brake protein YcgR
LELLRPNDPLIYTTLVQEVREEDFAVQLPMVGEVELPLRPGERVQIRVSTERGRYVFDTVVLDRYWDRVPLCRLAKPKEVLRQQLRQYVRWKVSLEVAYEPVPPEEVGRYQKIRPRRKGVTVDLSGGGLQMITREPLAVDSLLALRFDLPTREKPKTITALGRVRRFAPCQIEGPPGYAVGVSFEDISESQRDAVIAFLFRRMIAERQRLVEEEREGRYEERTGQER